MTNTPDSFTVAERAVVRAAPDARRVVCVRVAVRAELVFVRGDTGVIPIRDVTDCVRSFAVRFVTDFVVVSRTTGTEFVVRAGAVVFSFRDVVMFFVPLISVGAGRNADVIVPAEFMRDAARTTSSKSAACALHKASTLRYIIQNDLKTFIPFGYMLANL